MSCLIAEERERSECSIGYARKLSSTDRDRAAAHVPLPRITMSKSCLSARTFIMPEKQHRPQDRGPAGGVEGVYREAVNRCQTGKSRSRGLFAASQNRRPPRACARRGGGGPRVRPKADVRTNSTPRAIWCRHQTPPSPASQDLPGLRCRSAGEANGLPLPNSP